MDQEQFSKLKHDLRSDIVSILEAAKVLSKLPGLPPMAQEGLKLMATRRDRVLENLDKMSVLAKSGVYKDL